MPKRLLEKFRGKKERKKKEKVGGKKKEKSLTLTHILPSPMSLPGTHVRLASQLTCDTNCLAAATTPVAVMTLARSIACSPKYRELTQRPVAQSRGEQSDLTIMELNVFCPAYTLNQAGLGAKYFLEALIPCLLFWQLLLLDPTDLGVCCLATQGNQFEILFSEALLSQIFA